MRLLLLTQLICSQAFGFNPDAAQSPEVVNSQLQPMCDEPCLLIGSLHMSPNGLEKLLALATNTLNNNIAQISAENSLIPLAYTYKTPKACDHENPPENLTCVRLPDFNRDGGIPFGNMKMHPVEYGNTDGKLRDVQFEMVGQPNCDSSTCEMTIGIKSAAMETSAYYKRRDEKGYIMKPQPYQAAILPNGKGEMVTMKFKAKIDPSTGKLGDLISLQEGIDYGNSKDCVNSGSIQLKIPEGTLSLRSVIRDQYGKEKPQAQIEVETRQYVHTQLRKELAKLRDGSEDSERILDDQARTLAVRYQRTQKYANQEVENAEFKRIKGLILAKLHEQLKGLDLSPRKGKALNAFFAGFPELLGGTDYIRYVSDSYRMQHMAHENGFTEGNEGAYHYLAMSSELANQLLQNPATTCAISTMVTPLLDSVRKMMNQYLAATPEGLKYSGILDSIDELPTPSLQDFQDRKSLYNRLETLNETYRTTKDPKVKKEIGERIVKVEAAAMAITKRIEKSYQRLDLSVAIDKATNWGARLNIIHNAKACPADVKFQNNEAIKFPEDMSLEIPLSALNNYLKIMHKNGLLQVCGLADVQLDKNGQASTSHHDRVVTDADTVKNCPKTGFGVKPKTPPKLSFKNGEYVLSTEDLYVNGSRYTAEVKVKPELCNGTVCFRAKDAKGSAKSALWILGAGAELEAAISSVGRALANEGLPNLNEIPIMDLKSVSTREDGSIRLGWDMKVPGMSPSIRTPP